MIEVKLTLQNKEHMGAAVKYLQDVFKELHVEPIEMNEDEDVVKLVLYKQEAKSFVDRVLDDYATSGFEIKEEFGLMDMVLYTTDPELNHYFLCQRANINTHQAEAALEAIAEIASDSLNTEKALEKIDSVLAIAGSYRTRAIVDKIVQSLANNNIFIGEDVEQVLPRSIH